MKKRLVLISTLFTLALFVAVAGCRKADNLFYGTISFWNVDVNEDIYVTVDNNYTSTITALVNPSYCNNTTSANFYLPEGTHSYYAESDITGITWSGTFYIDTDCKLFELYR